MADLKQETKEVYLGPRDQSFKNMIENILRLGKLNSKWISFLLDDEGLQVYHSVFTHSSVDPENNYEFYEHLGDVTINKSIVWYLPRRFKQLACPAGVPTIAKLKPYLVSKKGLVSIVEAGKLNMWPFISAELEIKQKRMKKLIEDCFEAFIGATELLIEQKIRRGAGYEICYTILETLLDKMDIPLKYNIIVDPKSTLKETFDVFKQLGKEPQYTVTKKLEQYTQDDGKVVQVPVNYVTVSAMIGGRLTAVGSGKGFILPDAEQNAALQALEVLKTRYNIYKPIPEKFAKFLD